MVNYAETIIYKIVCKDLTIKSVYVGHTTNFRRRKHNHKSVCDNENRKEYNLNVYKFIRENGGWNNFEMIMVEEYNCENSLQAHQRERYWVETLNADLNYQIPSRTIREWYDDNREELTERKKKYYENNKEEILQQHKKYREENKSVILEKKKEKIICECGYETTRTNIARHQRSEKHLKLIEDRTE